MVIAPYTAGMKTNLAVFAVVAVVAFAVQLLLKVVVLQVIFGFANEAIAWQIVSALLIALIVTAVVGVCRPGEKNVIASSTSR